jgi:hypothetical protein
MAMEGTSMAMEGSSMATLDGDGGLECHGGLGGGGGYVFMLHVRKMRES